MRTHEEYRDDLPLYAVGALPAEESEDVARHLERCAECREEFSQLQQAAAQIALATGPLVPSPNVRKRLLAAVESERPPAAVLPEKRGSRARSAWFWAPAFSAAVLIVALAALWRYDQQLSRSNQELAEQLRSAEAATQQARQVVDTLTAADAQHVTLVSTGARVQPEAKTVYSARQRSLVLLASNLNALPAQKIYELWLLPADGAAPVPAGTFKPDAGGSATLVMSQLAGAVPAKGFAVTVENEPGASTPTMSIVLSGTV
jgi:anti-sigma-K factor RskA